MMRVIKYRSFVKIGKRKYFGKRLFDDKSRAIAGSNAIHAGIMKRKFRNNKIGYQSIIVRRRKRR